MAVRVVITREFKEGMAKEVFALFNKLRMHAMEQPGYISGETLQSAEEPQKLMVIATWHSVDDWINWKVNPVRKGEEAKLMEYLVKPADEEVYVYATYPYR